MEQDVAKLTQVALDQSSERRAPAARRRSAYVIAWLVAADALLILAGFAIAYALRYNVSWPAPFNLIVREVLTENNIPFTSFGRYALLLMAVLLFQFAMKGLYRLPRNSGLLDYAGKIVSSTTAGVALVVLLA